MPIAQQLLIIFRLFKVSIATLKYLRVRSFERIRIRISDLWRSF